MAPSASWTSAELVVGDVVVLNPGDIVPADCRVIRASSLEVDASSLTGESLPVIKNSAASFEPQIADRRSMLYAGTVIAAGRALAVSWGRGEPPWPARSERRAGPARPGRRGATSCAT
jgi:magnesium-transporting ATPase (P-type)